MIACAKQCLVVVLSAGVAVGFVQDVAVAAADEVRAQVLADLQQGLEQLNAEVELLQQNTALDSRDGQAHRADVAVFARAVQLMLQHQEFPKPAYADQAAEAIQTGLRRAAELKDDSPGWVLQTGTTIRGYVSQIDGTVQPYALTLPAEVNPKAGDRWPVHVKLHGRANDMNEVNFISRHEGQSLPEGQTWIQLDVYGRGNNAYRWAGESDVFEALADVRRRFRIDEDRITLHGFSMGGAGAWHLGLHYPDQWSSVGAGAGFVDFYNYQKQTSQLPDWQHATLGIYDAVDYALNASNVPVVTYGGENDSQLLAGTTMVEAARKQGVDIKLLIGPNTGHKFHPDSLREFMAFHAQHTTAGRRENQQRQQIRFTTRTLKYNQCDWLTIEEVAAVYEPSTVNAVQTSAGDVTVTTENVTALSLYREIGTNAIIDGQTLPCQGAADGLLPNVYYRRTADGWQVLDYDTSRAFQENSDRHKRHDLQGPIDDAFMDSFICVRGTGQPVNAAHQAWVDWTLDRFQHEFSKWLRGEVRVVDDRDLTDQMIAANNLVLFGDPSSNAVLQRILPRLPIQWQEDTITIGDRSWNIATHGLSLIYPNPLNPRRYVVINSGHTMHAKDFQASNSWLFPRLGDIAVQQFSSESQGEFTEQIQWAANFNSVWQLNPADLPAAP